MSFIERESLVGAVGVDVVERYAVPWTMVFGMKDR